jgi:Tat protein translocase TatB subunit
MIGPLEIMLVALVALLVFGPEKLPDMARTVGRTANQLRRMAADVKQEFDAELDFEDDEDKPAPAGRPTTVNRAAGAIPETDQDDLTPKDSGDDRAGDSPARDPDPGPVAADDDPAPPSPDPSPGAVAPDDDPAPPSPEGDTGAIAADLERLNSEPGPEAEPQPRATGDGEPAARSSRPATDADR